FANVVLADEINRTTPRTQSALLEAMNEAQVTVDGKTLPLPQPFLVIATQNPVEHHGTYPLPESQLDRFLMRIKMGYPSPETEREILRRRASDNPVENLEAVADVGEVLAMQESVTHVKVDASLHDYALEIVNRTRNSDQLALGVSPRGTLMLQRAAQARAFLEGRDYCVPDDFKQLAVTVFAHRVVASARHASLQKKSETTEAALREIVDSVRVPLVPTLAKRTPLRWIGHKVEYKISRAGWLYFGATLLVALAALNTGNNLLFLILACLVSVILMSGILSSISLAGIDLKIDLPEHIFAGQTVRA